MCVCACVLLTILTDGVNRHFRHRLLLFYFNAPDFTIISCYVGFFLRLNNRSFAHDRVLLQVVGLWVSPGCVKGCGPHGRIHERFTGHNQKKQEKEKYSNTPTPSLLPIGDFPLHACAHRERDTLFIRGEEIHSPSSESTHSKTRRAMRKSTFIVACNDKRRQFPAAPESPTRQRGVFPGLVGLTRWWISFQTH